MISVSDSQIMAMVSSLIWPFIRIAALIQTAPVFSHVAIPRRYKIGLALAITFVISPTLTIPEINLFSIQGVMTVFQQFIVGACMGFSLRVVFSAFELAGDMSGMQMGLGFASFIDPSRNANSPLLATFFLLVATLIFLITDGHLVLLFSLSESFNVIPIGPNPLSGINWLTLAGLGSLIFSAGVQLALPIVATILSINIGMGFLSRSAPQLNVISLGFAITLLAGMLALWYTIGVMAGNIEQITGVQIPYAK